MRLNELSPAKGSRKSRKRLGRGIGSGHGKTAGRGNKGHKSRSGEGARPGFEGGQMPIQRRLPKRGFTNIHKNVIAIINIRDLARFESGTVVDDETLIKNRLVKGKYDMIKLLGQGDIAIPITIKLKSVSKSAKLKIEAAGGKIEA